jgi:hypothetical protein
MRALTLLALSLSVLPTHAEDITWRADYRAALREAKQSGKPILVEFRCEA